MRDYSAQTTHFPCTFIIQRVKSERKNNIKMKNELPPTPIFTKWSENTQIKIGTNKNLPYLNLIAILALSHPPQEWPSVICSLSSVRRLA